MALSTHRIRRLPTILALALLLAGIGRPVAGGPPTPRKLLLIEPASTRAGIARVHLEVQNLRQNGETLEGTYQIRVPLRPRENDTGQVVLHTPAPIDRLGGETTTMTGSAVSETGRTHEVVARMEPDGVVRIRIVTPKRTLNFKSRFFLR